MWPDLFGAGSASGLMLAGALMAGAGAVVVFAWRHGRPEAPDPAAELWRRYAQGDLTSWEVVGLLQQLGERPPAAAASASVPEAAKAAPPSWSVVEAAGGMWGVLRRRAVGFAGAGGSVYDARAAR